MPPSMKSKVIISIFVILVCGCGYRAQGSSDSSNVALVSIPLISEDDDGILRNALAKAISETGKYRYSSGNAPYELVIKIENSFTDTIGYEWDVNAVTGMDVNRLYADEARKTVVALVTLIDCKTNEQVLEPFKVSAQVNYDYVNSVAKKDVEFRDFLGKETSTLQYSMGQLDSSEGAGNEAFRPLFLELAVKIGEVLNRAPVSKRVK